MEMVLDVLIKLAELLGPTIVALLTVPLMGVIKRLSVKVDGSPAALKQIMVVLIAAGLTLGGGYLNLALPETLSLFGEADVSALLSAAMAMGIHAGKKKTTL